MHMVSCSRWDVFCWWLTCLIDDRTLPSLATNTTWDKSFPHKVNIFLWHLKLDRLPHRLNLSSRGIEIPKIFCPSCNGNVESNVHIFFDCAFAKEIWRIIKRRCDDSFLLFDSNVHWIDWLNSWLVSREKKHRFSLVSRLLYDSFGGIVIVSLLLSLLEEKWHFRLHSFTFFFLA